MKNIFRLMLICTAAFVAACGSDSTGDTPVPGNGPITYKDCDDEVRVSTIESTLTVKFTASAAWTAKSTNVAWLTITSAKSGSKGTSTMTIRTTKNETGATRSGSIVMSVSGYDDVTLVTVTQGVAGSHPDFDVNVSQIDRILSENYLWNDEYNSIERDYAQAYDAFLKNTLLSMTTNDLDGGRNSDGSRYLYSYITRSGSGRAAVAKTAEVTNGIFPNLTFVNLGASGYALAVRGVYPDSPAAKAGLKRGDMITSVNGTKLTASNANTYYYNLLTQGTGTTYNVGLLDGRTMTLSAQSMYCNPVLHYEVINKGSKKIGYLVYSAFEASFDDEVLAAFSSFKAAGIDDIVIDLRLNGGGHVMSSQMITSVVAGDKADGKVFEKYRYNDTRMAKNGWSFPDKMRMEYFGAASGQSIYSTSHYLSMDRLYLLVTGNSASSSELTFNSLRGIDFPVTLIGERTEGKNVGMETQTFNYGGYSYVFAPITFQSYNAKNETGNPEGQIPDYEVKEWSQEIGYADWGVAGDPLLDKALELITGSAPAAAKMQTRMPQFVGIHNPVVPSRGAIVIPRDEE
ncbi:MAG: PDZ domain-containing protein [Alistipes sp.]|nr:PDZ domain-containing protein [Alistipes sp.]